MSKRNFFFIVFEGVEGTGKSFQINKLFLRLKKNKFPTVKTREPGGSYSAEKIRDIIFNKKNIHLDPLTDFYLMLAARNEHIKKTILKAKKNKQIIICDRFVDSTYAYQVVGNKIKNSINSINQNYIVGNLKPNLTIVLKSDMKTIFKRIKKRHNRNKFDKLSRNFYTKIQNSFIRIAKKNKNYIILDSSIEDNLLEKKIFNIVIKKIRK